MTLSPTLSSLLCLYSWFAFRISKLIKTLFIVIGASVTLWALSRHCAAGQSIVQGLVPWFCWITFFCMFYLTRSLINPIMYSLIMPLRCILQELKNKLKVPHWRSKNLAATKIELALNTFKKGSLCTVQKVAILWKCLTTLFFCLCSLQRIIHS